MPIISVEMLPGRTVDQKRALTKAVTDAFVSICGARSETVTVVFKSIDKENWGHAGRLACDPET
jgi:4-oxalocrotonate tautomerase